MCAFFYIYCFPSKQFFTALNGRLDLLKRARVASVTANQWPTLAQQAASSEPHMNFVRNIRTLEQTAYIWEMNCNPQADELFLVNRNKHVVHAMHVRTDADTGDVRDVYRGSAQDTSPDVRSVCHMRDLDALLVYSYECGPNNDFPSYWLVALSRRGCGGEWCEAHRVPTLYASLTCALSDSRVLLGQFNSKYLELFRVQSGPRIAHENCIRVPEDQKYICFSATCGSGGDTHVAMSYEDESVRVFRLVGDRLDEMARIRLEKPELLLWVASRLLVEAPSREYSGVVELELRGTQLERRAELIAGTHNFTVDRWCAMDDGLLVYNHNSKELLHYSLT